MKNQAQIKTTQALDELIGIVSQLREPIGGCPWDQEQTHQSLIPYLLEEAHEVADAIRCEDNENLCEELGDLLLQVILHAQIASEEGRFTLEDIAKVISKKLIRRHPHVFDKPQKLSINQVQANWEKIKQSEQPLKESSYPLTDLLRKKIKSQTALAGAMSISKKVANVGFEWETMQDVWDKVNEELDELKEALLSKNKMHAQQELGDVLFTLVNIARWIQISPEESLAGTNKRFLARFSYIESALKGQFSGHSLHELEKLWKEAKKQLEKSSQAIE